GLFPQHMSVAARFHQGRWQGTLTTPQHHVDLEGVRSVWYRAPSKFALPAMSPAHRHHAHTEAKLGLGGVLLSLPAAWLNPPGAHADAGYKPLQLAAAARSGLTVVDTIITNSAHTVRSFTEQAGANGVVTKMLGAPTLVDDHGQRRVAFTDHVTQDTLGDLAGIESTAHQFQHWVPKAAEARVIVVGQRLFAATIHAHSPEGTLDWRRDYDGLSYDTVDPPEGVQQGVHALMATLGLVYGALDFVITPDGQWVFLEINPGGQYGWLEQHAG